MARITAEVIVQVTTYNVGMRDHSICDHVDVGFDSVVRDLEYAVATAPGPTGSQRTLGEALRAYLRANHVPVRTDSTRRAG